MTDPTEIARVAAGLTFIEQCFLSEGRIRMAFPFEVQARDRLMSKGLVEKRWFSYRFTPLARAVRDHILREKSGG